MLEALRGLGYSTAAALADIVDNSVAAGAGEVRIQFTWDERLSQVAVLDDGLGMDDGELERAMRLGEKSPLDPREPGDLGRFGIGLKTASFSQCRRLTVTSTKDGERHCLRWDLDALAASRDDEWRLFEGPAPGSEELLSPIIGRNRGTLVIWEVMDRIVTPGYTVQDFLDLVDRVQRHLAMVFHRYLQGPRPRLLLLVNGNPVEPWDPFMADHPAKPWQFRPPREHALVLRVGDERRELQPGERYLLPQGMLVYEGLTTWMGYKVFYDWTLPWLLASCLLAVVSLTWHYWQKFAAQPWEA